MTGRSSRRHRWVAAAMMGLVAAGGTLAQVTSSGSGPPTEAISIPTLPPLVVTPPTPPVKSIATPPSPPVKLIASPSPSSVPVIVVPTMPKAEPPPVIAVPTLVIEPAKPAAPAITVSVPNSAKPAMAEIISGGPKTIDATASFATALAEAKAAYGKVRDYSGHILIQERVKGVLQAEQTAEIRVRTQPRSIALKFLAPSALVGRELAFMDGFNGNKIRVKAAGTFGPLAFATVPPSDPKSAVSARFTIPETGIGPVLDRIERALATEAKMRNPVAVTAADFTFAGKTVTRYELFFDRPHALRDAARLVVCIDPDTKLPVRLEAFDAPTAGRVEGDLRDSMSFVNLTFNQGIGERPFLK